MPVSKKNSGSSDSAGSRSQETEEAKRTQLETKLESLLSSVEGVGKARVLIMTNNNEELPQTYASHQDFQVTGVLIAAEGGGNPVTVRNIQQAVMALFQLEAHKIKVMKMK